MSGICGCLVLVSLNNRKDRTDDHQSARRPAPPPCRRIPLGHRSTHRCPRRSTRLPTPCDEFDVRAPASHLIVVAGRAVAIGEIGDALVEFGQEDRHDVDTYAGLAARAIDVWADDTQLAAPVRVPWGEVPGAGALWGYVNETLAHGWDLAVATGQNAQPDPTCAEDTLVVARQFIPAEIHADDTVPFGSVLEPRPDRGPPSDWRIGVVGRLPGGRRSTRVDLDMIWRDEAPPPRQPRTRGIVGPLETPVHTPFLIQQYNCLSGPDHSGPANRSGFHRGRSDPADNGHIDTPTVVERLMLPEGLGLRAPGPAPDRLPLPAGQLLRFLRTHRTARLSSTRRHRSGKVAHLPRSTVHVQHNAPVRAELSCAVRLTHRRRAYHRSTLILVTVRTAMLS